MIDKEARTILEAALGEKWLQRWREKPGGENDERILLILACAASDHLLEILEEIRALRAEVAALRKD